MYFFQARWKEMLKQLNPTEDRKEKKGQEKWKIRWRKTQYKMAEINTTISVIVIK